MLGPGVCLGPWLLGLGYLLLVGLVLAPAWAAPDGTVRGIAHGLTRALFVLLLVLGGINLGFYVVGFFESWRVGRPAVSMDARRGEAGPEGRVPTVAIAMAIYHEDPAQVGAGVRRMMRSLRQAGLGGQCDFFLLCDSTDPGVRAAEHEMHAALEREFVGAPGPGWQPPSERRERGGVYLVRRPDRSGYKVGNITHFLEHYGHAYDYMLELDADSEMLGSRIEAMLTRMEGDSSLGLLQANIIPRGSATLFARSMEYSMARTLPLHAAGMSRIFGRQCTFWGHNALIRVQSFLRHAALPLLPGPPPLGGRILSHDIVEAALLGRGGCAVEWDHAATGSYDRMPEDAIAYGRRDRRWCQGNLQHFWLVFGDGMRPWHRFYFLNGIFSYLSGPMVVALSVVGFAQMASQPSNSASWSFHPGFIVVMLCVLGLPRLLGLGRLALRAGSLWDPKGSAARRCLREATSALADLLLSMALAPMVFYMHLRAVLEVVGGQSVSWQSHPRGARRLGWGEATGMFWVPTLVGWTWAGAAFWFVPGYLPYLFFLIFGWVFSIPLAVVTSSPGLGGLAARMGLFEECLTREEVAEIQRSEGDGQIPAPMIEVPAAGGGDHDLSSVPASTAGSVAMAGKRP